MEFKTRLKTALKNQGITTQRLEQLCGFSNGYINNLKKAPKEDKLRAILEVLSNIEPAWLLTGEGSMLKEVNQQNVPIPKDLERNYQDRISALEEKVQMLNETITAQKQIIEDQKWLIDSLRSQIVRLEAKKTEAASVSRPGVTTDGDSLSFPKGV